MTDSGSAAGLHESDAAEHPLLLAMRGVSKRYGAAIALNGVDFEARTGQIHALLGENGAGKSTLMQILAGLTRPDGGQILLNDSAITLDSPREARRRGIAMALQHFTLVPAFTVAENLALDRPASGFGPYTAREAAAPTLARAESLGWKFDPEARVSDLSVGTQQRIEIVKALATGAELLIFDEPTAVLSPPEINELFRVLRALKKEGKAVILIAHKLAEILAVADVVTVLRRGVRVAHLPVADTDATRLAALMVGEEIFTTEHTERNAEVRGEKNKALSPPSALRPPPSFSAVNIMVRGDRGETAIAGLTLEARNGEILGIGGVDGNGQAELAEALVGLRPIAEGAMTWNGDAFQPGTAPTTGYIPQDRRRAGLAVTMGIEENLLLETARTPEYRIGPFLKRKALRTLAANLIHEFDIRTSSPLLPASALSGGNQQKIVAARALHARPEWIVAMNPTRGLDIGAIRFVHEQLRRARERGAAIVLISTDLDEIFALADRAGIYRRVSCAARFASRERGGNWPDAGRSGNIRDEGCWMREEAEPPLWKTFAFALLQIGGYALGLIALLYATFVFLRVPPMESLRAIWVGAFGDAQSGHWYAISETLVKTTPLLLTGLGVVVAWRAGLFSIGGEGQLIVGAIAATFTARLLPSLPGPLLTLLMVIAGIAAGAAWGGIAGWLRVRRGVQEVISTIMLNYIALYLLGWLVEGPLQEKARRLSQSEPLPDAALFARVLPPSLSNGMVTRLHSGILLALFVTVGVAIYLFGTSSGFSLRIIGQNPDAARTARIPVDKLRIQAMLLSGGLCGLAGVTELLGVSGRLYANFSPGWGYTAIPVALLGGLNPSGTLLSALFFGGLSAGSSNLSRFSGVSSVLIYIVQAASALAIVGTRAWRNRNSTNIQD